MIIERTFDLIINAGTSSPLVINANQNDSGEIWKFNLYQEDGTKVIPAAGEIVGLKSDGHAIVNAGTVNESGQVVITETAQITAAPGANVYEIVFDSVHSVHGTANFILYVEKSPVDDDADFSESDISAIQQAIAMAIDAQTVAALQNGLAQESATRAAQDAQLAGDISEEATTRAAADAVLRRAIDDAAIVPAGSTVVVDNTLSIAGAAADAKKTGDAVSDLNQAISLKSLLYETIPSLREEYVFRMSTHDFTTGYGNRFANTGMISLPSEIYAMQLSGTNAGSNAQAANFAFFDENKQYIEGSATDKLYTSVPDGAYFVAIGNFNANRTHTGVKCIYYRYKVLQTMEENAQKIESLESVPAPVHPSMTAGGWLQNGVVINNGNQQLSYSDFIEIPLSAYAVSCNIGVFFASTTIAFYDENKTFLSGYAQKSHDIVQNAKYMRLCNYTGSGVQHDDVTYLFQELERIVNIENELENLNDRVDKCVPNWEGKKWCVIGDSITEENFRTTKNYWAYIEDLTNVTIDNQGIGGTGYKQYLPFYDRINANTFPEDCDVITMFGGVNDIVGWDNEYPIGNFDDSTNATICGCVNLAIDALEAKYTVFCPLGIISPLPCKVDTSYEAFSTARFPDQYPLLTSCRMETFVTELKKLCAYRGYPFLDIYHDSGLRPWNAKVKRELFAPPAGYGYKNGDGLHPNAEGHKLFYKKILEFIKTIIED